jgi:hypothetical protein
MTRLSKESDDDEFIDESATKVWVPDYWWVPEVEDDRCGYELADKGEDMAEKLGFLRMEAPEAEIETKEDPTSDITQQQGATLLHTLLDVAAAYVVTLISVIAATLTALLGSNEAVPILLVFFAFASFRGTGG